MLTELAEPFPNVRIGTFEGLLVDYCRAEGAGVIVKGLRSAADYDYELQMAQLNHAMTGVDTMFLPTRVGERFHLLQLGQGDRPARRRRRRLRAAACSRAVTGEALGSPRIGRAAAELVM